MSQLHFFKTLFTVCCLATFLLLPTTSVLALSAVVHIPEKYTDVKAGERLYFELEIRYPENSSRKDLRLEYEIVKDGEVIATSKFLKAVETQASFMDYVVIPETASGGLHEIRVQVKDYETLSEEVSASFKVINKDNEFKIYFYIIVGMIVILGVVISWEINRLKKFNQ
jgi:hypothetical protein